MQVGLQGVTHYFLVGQEAMKQQRSEKQEEMLLSRHVGHIHNVPVQAKNGGLRVLQETLAGLFLGIPLGITLYYITLADYCPIMWCLFFAGESIGAAFHFPTASRLTFVQGVNFGPIVVGLLAALATAFSLYFTHWAMLRGYRVFAWVQLPLMLPSLLALFYLTLFYHKPLLPFYGQ